jgi:hypothetical protein
MLPSQPPSSPEGAMAWKVFAAVIAAFHDALQQELLEKELPLELAEYDEAMLQEYVVFFARELARRQLARERG